jgi:hypothetical protein
MPRYLYPSIVGNVLILRAEDETLRWKPVTMRFEFHGPDPEAFVLTTSDHVEWADWDGIVPALTDVAMTLATEIGLHHGNGPKVVTKLERISI